jgi:hypothetical protein
MSSRTHASSSILESSAALARRARLLLPALALAAGLAGCAVQAHRVHGEPDFTGPHFTVAEVLAAPETHDGDTVVVSGRVAEVCPIKGCWMMLAADGREMRVTFRDYAFFVPTDCGGADVEVKGTFTISMIPAADAAHYLEDAGRHAEAAAITGPVQGYTLVATGARFPIR